MSKTNKFLFGFVTVIAWIIFVGLCIEAGALIVNFIFSIVNPAMVKNLYEKMDLSGVYNRNQSVFYTAYGFALAIEILKAILFYIVIRLLWKIDMNKPFNTYVSRQITLMSYFTLAIGLLNEIAKKTGDSLLKNFNIDISALGKYWVDSSAFITMAAVIYVIAMIFAKGVELQNENELTI
jgi:hypothetical protein